MSAFMETAIVDSALDAEHLGVIDKRATEPHVPADRVETIYGRERQRLESNARIVGSIGVVAARNTRAALKNVACNA